MSITRRTPYNDLPEWMTVDEVATHLGFNAWTIYQHVQQGKIPKEQYKRFGKRIMISKLYVQPAQVVVSPQIVNSPPDIPLRRKPYPPPFTAAARRMEAQKQRREEKQQRALIRESSVLAEAERRVVPAAIPEVITPKTVTSMYLKRLLAETKPKGETAPA